MKNYWTRYTIENVDAIVDKLYEMGYSYASWEHNPEKTKKEFKKILRDTLKSHGEKGLSVFIDKEEHDGFGWSDIEYYTTGEERGDFIETDFLYQKGNDFSDDDDFMEEKVYIDDKKEIAGFGTRRATPILKKIVEKKPFNKGFVVGGMLLGMLIGYTARGKL